MVHLSKKTLALILLFVLLLGAAGTVLVMKSGLCGAVLVESGYFDELSSYQTKYAKLDRIKQFILNNYYTQFDEEALDEGMYNGLIGALDDPYSMYIGAEDYAEYMEQLLGTSTYCGVGITFYTDPVEKGFYASAVNTKGPAYAAGVRKGDIITAVDGIDALTLSGDDLRDHIRGEEGTSVKITLLRGSKSYEINIKREEIPTESVVYEMLDGGIAYIQITEFIQDTGTDFADALRKAEKAGAKGLVIDLRDNGGGLVNASLQVADMLMNQGTVVKVIDQDGNTEIYSSESGRTALKYAVLVNGNSASASEILCSGIQDNKEGTIIGTLTYGKGIIQDVCLMSDGSAVKYTKLQYLTPNGSKIHGIGITPDIIVELTLDCYDENGFLVNDVQLNKAIEILKEQ